MTFKVTFCIGYQRNNDDTDERDPTDKELEDYIARSSIIPQNPDYLDEIRLISEVTYIGNRQFCFTCESRLDPAEIADLFLKQSLADGEWGAAPGNGSFVYPTKATTRVNLNEYDMPEELGLLFFEYVMVDGPI
jgi:hypothetical protein